LSPSKEDRPPLFGSAELLYARRSSGIGELLGGGDEHWEIVDANSQDVVGTVAETDLSVLRRAGRFLNNLFPAQQRRSLEVRDGAGQALLSIAKPVPKLGLEYAEVHQGDGVPAGTIRLVRTAGPDQLGLGFFDPRDERLGEIRYSPERSSATGHKTFTVITADGLPAGELQSTRSRGGGGPVGYRLRVDDDPPDPLRSLIYASPVVRYFIH